MLWLFLCDDDTIKEIWNLKGKNDMSKKKVRYIIGAAILVLAVVLVFAFCGKHSEDAEQSHLPKKDDVIEEGLKSDDENSKDEESGLQVKEDETETGDSINFGELVSDDEKKDTVSDTKTDSNASVKDETTDEKDDSITDEKEDGTEVKEDTEQGWSPLF